MNVIVCIPGNTFSDKFLVNWTNFIGKCYARGIRIYLSNRYTSNVYYVRSMCLGADVLRGENQKPFDGKLEYDYILWIDSDISFKFEDFTELLSHKKDIIGGLYLMEGGTNFAVVTEENWDWNFFLKNGYFKFLSPPELSKYSNPIKVSYTGFGFLLIKKGVFEKIKYPWFEPKIYELENGIRDFASEDVSFCIKAKEYGYDIFIDKNVIVGHEKMTTLNVKNANQ